MMKKTISLILTLMLTAMFTVDTAAAEIPDEQAESLYLKYCVRYNFTPHEIYPGIGEIGQFEVRGFSGDWALCYTLYNPQPAFYQVKLGAYAVAPGTWGFPVSTCISVISLTTDTVYDLEEAYSADVVDMAEVKDAFPDFVKLTGDWNNDGKLSVGDVLMLQKYMAKIIEGPGESYKLSYYAADFNDDGSLDLNDALMMQKVLAKVI